MTDRKSIFIITVIVALAAAGAYVYQRKPAPVKSFPPPHEFRVESIAAKTETVTPAAKTVKTVAVSAAANPQFGTGIVDAPNGQFRLVVPVGLYVRLDSYTPAFTPADNGGYVACGYNSVKGFDTLPCCFLFPSQSKRWVVLRFCAGGEKPGSPAKCYCRNGEAGKSGNCKG